MKLGTFDFTSDESFKYEIITWLNYRNDINNKLLNTSKKFIMYKKSLSGNYDKTDNITDFSHFCLHDIYTDDELIKLKHLINYRHELRINHKYNGKYEAKINKDEFIKKINDFFNSNKMVSVSQFNKDPTTFEYLIYQTLHCYDQIINEMVKIRFVFLDELRYKFSNASDEDRDNIFKDAEKIIVTLQQYLNYPLTFQYKFADTKSCFHLLSEDINKILLDKYLKMLSVYLYCINNDIDILNALPIPTSKDILDKLSIKSKIIFSWDKLDDPFNKTVLQNIIKNINLANIQQSDYLLTKDISTEIKRILKEILIEFNKDPTRILNSTLILSQNDYMDIYKKIDGTTLFNQLKQLGVQIPDIIYLQFIRSQGIADSEQPYFDSTYLSDIDKINEDIQSYNQECNSLRLNIQSTIDDLNEIFTCLNVYNRLIIDIRNIIDKSNDLNWTSTFKNALDSTIDQSASIDYTTVDEIQKHTSLKLSNLNHKLANLHNQMKIKISEFQIHFNSIKQSIDSANVLKDTINTNTIKLHQKITSEVTSKTATLINLRDENIQLNADNSTLIAKNANITGVDIPNLIRLLGIDQTDNLAKNAELTRKTAELSVKKSQLSSLPKLDPQIATLKTDIGTLAADIRKLTAEIRTSDTNIAKINRDIQLNKDQIKLNDIKINTNTARIEQIKDEYKKIKLHKDSSEHLFNDTNSNIDKIINYKGISDPIFSSILLKYNEIKTTYVDSILYNTATDYDFNKLPIRLSNIFDKLKYLSSSYSYYYPYFLILII